MGNVVLSIRDFDSSPEAALKIWHRIWHRDMDRPRLCIPCVDFEAGKCYAVVGKSGAGKTVLNSLLLGLPSSRVGSAVHVGSMDWWNDAVRICAADFSASSRLLSRWRDVRHRGTLLYLPQILPDGRGYQMSTRIYLEHVIAALIRQADIDPRAIHNPFETFPDALHGVLGNKVTSLSGGERRRVELWARLTVLQALSKDRLALLILDEPTTGLDVPDERRYLEELRWRMTKLPNLCVLVTTHALYFIDDHLPQTLSNSTQLQVPLFDKVCLVHKEPCSGNGSSRNIGPICRVTSAIDSGSLCKSVMRRTPEKSVEDSMEAFVDWQAGLSGNEFSEKVANVYFMGATK